jgi:protein SCO1/2
MNLRNPFALLAATVITAFVVFLVGILTWVGLDSPKSGPFNAQFSLLDDHGKPVDQSLFKGSPSIVYFGYTHCPEVCPTTLMDVTAYLNELGEDGLPLKTYFFSIDPERDTPEIMRGYVTAFTDRIIGVTGEPDEMRKVVKGWKVYAEKQPNDKGGYSMNHTTSLLLVGADGRLKGLLPYGMSVDDAVVRIRSALL